MSLTKDLLQSNVEALGEGAALLGLLKPEQYTQGYTPAFHSTIGAHFRHVLEHYRCFLSQLASGQICYDKRQRDQLLECDFDYAARSIDELSEALNSLKDNDLGQTCTIVDEQAESPVGTTVYRELLFLQSHTMHHYAIIGAMTRALGAKPADDFGVAIATRSHQKTTQQEHVHGGTSTCAQ